jgi:hypothetical protein
MEPVEVGTVEAPERAFTRYAPQYTLPPELSLLVTVRVFFAGVIVRDRNAGAGVVALKLTASSRSEDASCWLPLQVGVTQGASVYGALLIDVVPLEQCAEAEHGSVQSTQSCGAPPAVHCLTIQLRPLQLVVTADRLLDELVSALTIALAAFASLHVKVVAVEDAVCCTVSPIDAGTYMRDEVRRSSESRLAQLVQLPYTLCGDASRTSNSKYVAR